MTVDLGSSGEQQQPFIGQRRVALNGQAYTYADFLEYYGSFGHEIWPERPVLPAAPEPSEHGRKGDGKSDYAGNAGKAGGKSDYEPGKGKFEHGRTGDGKSDYAGDAGKGGAESGCCREQQLAGWMKAKGEAKGAGKYKGKGEAKGTGKDEGKSKGEPQGCGKGEVKLRVEEIGDHTKITCEKAVYKITGDSWTRL